jgi:hypothetical protein
MGDAFADRLNHTCRLHAQLHGQIHRVQAAALVHVDVIQTNRVVKNPHLTGARLTNRNVNQAHLVWATMLVNLNRTGQMSGHTNSKNKRTYQIKDCLSCHEIALPAGISWLKHFNQQVQTCYSAQL